MKKIWVGYSGGVDSHVLLHAISKIFTEVNAIHINHGLSPNANSWQEHCASVCKDLNINFCSERVTIDLKQQHSAETLARDARREVWSKMLGADDILLLAHHADDQVETVLFRLIRGAGPKGLSGMQSKSILGKTKILRPLLNISKKEILDYAEQHKLQYIIDESNADQKYSRNFLRHSVIPMIKGHWPGAEQNILRAAKNCESANSCIEQEAEKKLEELLDQNQNLVYKKLTNHKQFWQNELLRRWLQRHGIIPSVKHLQTIRHEVIGARADAQPHLYIGNKFVRRDKFVLYVD